MTKFRLPPEMPARIMQIAAFSTSFYLTMDMFVEMVRGDPIKEWIFRGVALVFESSKLSILKKSFLLQRHKIAARCLALCLMVVSVSMASMSAARAAGSASQEALTLSESGTETINDLVIQRDILVERQKNPAVSRIGIMEYQFQIDSKQKEIDALRTARTEQVITVQRRGGVFYDVADLLKLGKNGAGYLRFGMFILLIILIECILFAETYFIAIAELAAMGIEERPTLFERMKRWKIFHNSKIYTETDLEDAVKETIEKIKSLNKAPQTGAMEELF